MSDFKHIFSPLKIGNVRCENRIAMAPMATLGYGNFGGGLSQRTIDYYLERARGGVGLIITGAFKVENTIDPITPDISIVSPSLIASLTELTEALHALGTKIFIQLTAGFGRVTHPVMLTGQPVSASAIPNYWDPKLMCREITVDEIRTIIECFGNAAELLSLTGIDGIELHGHEGYLFDQFKTSLWNKRTDAYGGSLENRLRFSLEVMEEIKNRLGRDFPVEYRYGLKHYAKGIDKSAVPGEEFEEAGRDTDEGIEIARIMEKAGMDALHVDAGCYDSWYWAHPPNFFEQGCLTDLFAKVKQAVNIPIIGVGRLDDPEIVNREIGEGRIDMAAIGRGLLSDPHWTAKVRQGKVDHIRPCVGCHDGCLGRIFEGKPLSCSLNPTVGRERTYALEPTRSPQNIVVVGGGIGGLEAARVLALRGHQVKLFERRDQLGGHVISGSIPKFKKDLRRLLDWYAIQLEKEGVEVLTGTEMTQETLLSLETSCAIIATGSTPITPNINGLTSDNAMFVSDFLTNMNTLNGKTVTVIGGGHSGCEAALWAAQNGKKARIVEMLPELMSGGLGVPYVNLKMMLDMLKYYNVEIFTGSQVVSVSDNGVTIIDGNGSEQLMQTEEIVYSIGLKSDRTFYDKIRNQIPDVYLIGDAVKPRNIQAAVWEAYEVARFI